MKFPANLPASIIVSYSLLMNFAAADALLSVTVTNHSNEFVKNAVISAFPQRTPHRSPPSTSKTAVIDQIDKEFIAFVTPIQNGSTISFPNHDQIRHHVYSFSPAKLFEIPLYKGVPINPILFDTAGVVALGCNIHDWMSAYVYVVETPYFTLTDKKGEASLELPSGDYEIRYWHPNIDGQSANLSQTITLEAGSTQAISAQINLKQVWLFRRGPVSFYSRGKYR